MRSLQKPSQTAWAVNQLARRRHDDVAALLEAGERLRRAQAAALGAPGGGAAVREATAAERQAVSRLTQAAEELLAAEGRPPTQALLERVAATLRAAAVDEEARPLLDAGRLVSEVEPSGFGTLAALAPAQPRPQALSQPGRDEAAARRREAQARVRELRAELREREREVREAEREAERAEKAAAAARAAAEEAHRAAAAVAERLDEAESALRES